MSLKDSKDNIFAKAMSQTEKADTNTSKGIINKESGSSMVYDKDGNVNLASGNYTQYKHNANAGSATEISLHSNTITVQKDIVANDISVNYHKLNSQLYELTNMKQVMGTAIGNLTMAGTVLVKTYEPTLKKWVLMRRPVRIPIFSNLLDAYAIDDLLDVDLAETYDDIADYKINRDNSNGKSNKYKNIPKTNNKKTTK